MWETAGGGASVNKEPWSVQVVEVAELSGQPDRVSV